MFKLITVQNHSFDRYDVNRIQRDKEEDKNKRPWKLTLHFKESKPTPLHFWFDTEEEIIEVIKEIKDENGPPPSPYINYGSATY